MWRQMLSEYQNNQYTPPFAKLLTFHLLFFWRDPLSALSRRRMSWPINASRTPPAARAGHFSLQGRSSRLLCWVGDYPVQPKRHFCSKNTYRRVVMWAVRPLITKQTQVILGEIFVIICGINFSVSVGLYFMLRTGNSWGEKRWPAADLQPHSANLKSNTRTTASRQHSKRLWKLPTSRFASSPWAQTNNVAQNTKVTPFSETAFNNYIQLLFCT